LVADVAAIKQVARLAVDRLEVLGDRFWISQRIEIDRLLGVDVGCRPDVDGGLVAIVENTTDISEQVETGNLAGLERVGCHRIGVELGFGSFDDCLFVLAFSFEEGILTD